ncbi:MAG: hypothetical protein EOM59_22200 [Clostridia bacterium]|nr:hypothetical protein [Clostridia bacterium]
MRILDRGEDMDNKNKPIKFEDMGFSPKDKLKIPSRRELSSRPWSDDQIRAFIVRQKYVPNILAEMGIKIKGTISYEQARTEREKELEVVSSQKDN